MLEVLQQLGFSEKESRVYVALLEQGRTTPAQLSKVTRISRPTVYHLVKSLEAKGLVSEDLAGTKRYIVAQPPKRLAGLLEEDRVRLSQKESLIQQAVQQLTTLPQMMQLPVPKIRFIQGAEVKKFLYREAPVWNASVQAADKVWWGFQDPTLAEEFRPWIDWLWKEIHKDVAVKILSNRVDVERRLQKIHKKREVRVLKKPIAFTATVGVAGEYLILLVTNAKPHYLIEIHDRLLSENLRELCKSLWEQAEAL